MNLSTTKSAQRSTLLLGSHTTSAPKNCCGFISPHILCAYKVWEKSEMCVIFSCWSHMEWPTSVTSDSKPLELFERFFPEEAWALAVEETNHYANTVCGTTPKSRPWKDTNIIEMKAFVGMLICFGVLKLPRIEMYWSSKYVHSVVSKLTMCVFICVMPGMQTCTVLLANSLCVCLSVLFLACRFAFLYGLKLNNFIVLSTRYIFLYANNLFVCLPSWWYWLP